MRTEAATEQVGPAGVFVFQKHVGEWRWLGRGCHGSEWVHMASSHVVCHLRVRGPCQWRTNDSLL